MKTASIIHLATHGLLDYGVQEILFERNILGAITHGITIYKLPLSQNWDELIDIGKYL